MTLLTFGTKLVLIGGIIFVTALIMYMQPGLGFEEQGLLSWTMMASFIVWIVGAIYLGVAGDHWLSRGIRYQSNQK
ncbi:MAG: hypothetical protein GEU26_10170 [Nitrososphaeraceae archaeon]|nr:hypothetical protein [Nitrososphaeraceae archaeon]